MKGLRKIIVILLSAIVVGMVFSCRKSPASNKKKKEVITPIDSTFTEVIHPEWTRSAVIYEVNLRQYTHKGDIESFEKHLPRLKELGVDILWFMPVFPISELYRKGELGSYYAVKDYMDINPEFGTLDDFKHLVRHAHDLGFKVIMDWVANHSGCDNNWVTEHPEWYLHDSAGIMLSRYDWTDVYELDYRNAAMRAEMIKAMKFWVKEVGVDGFRCDVASGVPTDFWNLARQTLDSIRPMFMLAEAYKPELNKKAFDMGYNWPLCDLFTQISRTKGENKMRVNRGERVPVKHAIAIDSLLADEHSRFPQDVYQMNMITNHDYNSWSGTEFKRLGRGVEAFTVLAYTLPGMPLIYTGQEVGNRHAFEFFKKDYAPNWKADNHFTEFFKKLNALKHNYRVLAAGVAGAPVERYKTTNHNVYIFSRRNERCAVYVFANLSSKYVSWSYTGEVPRDTTAINYFKDKSEEFPTTMLPWEYRVYVSKK